MSSPYSGLIRHLMTSRGMNSSSRIYNLILSRAFQTFVVTLGAESHKIISQGWVGPNKPSHKRLPQNLGLVHPTENFQLGGCKDTVLTTG